MTTWLELSKQPDGTRVVFTQEWNSPQCIVPVGTTATIVENGLNKIWQTCLVRPDSAELQSFLFGWGSCIHLVPPGNREPDWQKQSPVATQAL
jgi:hypothetical protein